MVTTMRTSVVTRTKFSTSNLDLLFMGVLIVQFILIIFTDSCIQICVCMPGGSTTDCHHMVHGKNLGLFYIQ
jgi:hypothetical protein